ncbi:aldose 1-epimerase [Neoasaia chiangmaiensis NBRC 101099]|uniref:Aldose epimerase n=1 Tax=Neoasaia chiangmaiensis TaxID=320497 RepID=A0A1U9KN53_9PROT|nr:aldose 1-epimerase [Neoasaia chiangmaiensis]AQS87231.1 aldose epimerase [Neoasaia chiangmaiensis]GBR38393.1 aldose 1-epimerase [Neoasaia chiangmaiensis NBRC 101099]GEN15914.1 aldose 1-epimerase [Neoasaia chiangmaiensis]
MIELARGNARVGILPETGGGLAFWRVNDRDVLVPTVDSNLRAQQGVGVAAYPLVPYSNRIGEGRFSFDGQDFELANNIGGEPHSIHGNAWERVWEVVQEDPDRAILLLDHRPDTDERKAEWPFAYRAVLSYVLDDQCLNVELVVVNQDEKPQPIGFGFHPFFSKSDATTLLFHAQGVWESGPDGLPAQHVATEGAWSFAPAARPVRQLHLDNCFAGWNGHAEIDDPDGGYRIVIEADEVFRHLVVFTAPEKPFVAVEPVTNMNDAIHHPEILERGLQVVPPGQRISGSMRFRLVDDRG